MNTWIIIGIIALVALVVIFRKHLKKIGIGIGILIASWIGIETVSKQPVLLPDDGVEIPIIDSTEIDKPELPKDTIAGVFNIKLSEDENIDQTVSLQQQIDKIPDGNPEAWNVIQLPEGKFWTEGDSEYKHLQDDGIITIWNRKNLIIRGDNTIFYTKAPATPYGGNVGKNDYSYRRHIWIRFSSNIVIENIKIEGSNNIDGRLIGTTPEFTPEFWKGGPDTGSIGGSPAYTSYWEQEHALDIRASTNVTVRNFDVDGVWGDGIYIGGDQRFNENLQKNEWVPAVNTIIQDCHLRYTGRQGIAAGNNVEGLLIENVIGELGRRAFIDLEPDLTANYIDGVEIRNCRTNTAQTVIAAVGNGRVDNVYIHDNAFSGGGHFIICYDSLKKTKRKNWRVENNTRTGGFGSPIADIRFALTDNIILKGNNTKVGATQSRKSAEFTNCQNVKVIGNDFGNGKYIDGRGSEIILENNTPKQKIL